MNLQILKNQYPEVVEQIKDQALREAVETERERIIQLAAILNPAAAEKVRVLAEAGLDAKQAKALFDSVSTVSGQDKKSEILAALKEAHGEGAAGNVPEMPRGENALLSAVHARNKVADSRRNQFEAEKQRVE